MIQIVKNGLSVNLPVNYFDFESLIIKANSFWSLVRVYLFSIILDRHCFFYLSIYLEFWALFSVSKYIFFLSLSFKSMRIRSCTYLFIICILYYCIFIFYLSSSLYKSAFSLIFFFWYSLLSVIDSFLWASLSL